MMNKISRMIQDFCLRNSSIHSNFFYNSHLQYFLIYYYMYPMHYHLFFKIQLRNQTTSLKTKYIMKLYPAKLSIV